MAEKTIRLELTVDEFTLVIGSLTKTFNSRGMPPIVAVAMMMARPSLQGLLDKMTAATEQGTIIMKEERAGEGGLGDVTS